ncbi:hypothetical protein NQZ68_028271 [Dissostichus eleginoides]|nr:hypothetical protein NQZ68_028271 [Dissostichus eleginoides]
MHGFMSITKDTSSPEEEKNEQEFDEFRKPEVSEEVCDQEVLYPKNLQAKACFQCLVHLHPINHPVPEVILGEVPHQEDLLLDLPYLVASSLVLLQIKKLLVQGCFQSLEVSVPSPKLDLEYPHPDQQLQYKDPEVQSLQEKDYFPCLVDKTSKHQKLVRQLLNQLNRRLVLKFPLCSHLAGMETKTEPETVVKGEIPSENEKPLQTEEFTKEAKQQLVEAVDNH